MTACIIYTKWFVRHKSRSIMVHVFKCGTVWHLNLIMNTSSHGVFIQHQLLKTICRYKKSSDNILLPSFNSLSFAHTINYINRIQGKKVYFNALNTMHVTYKKVKFNSWALMWCIEVVYQGNLKPILYVT